MVASCCPRITERSLKSRCVKLPWPRAHTDQGRSSQRGATRLSRIAIPKEVAMLAHDARALLIILCAGLLSTAHREASAQTVDAILFAVHDPHCSPVFPPTSLGISLRTPAPANAVLGHLPPAGTFGEVAFTQAVISVGQDVPLPTYLDGSYALESEVFWTTHLWLAQFPGSPCIVRYIEGDHAVATFNGLRFASGTIQVNGAGGMPALTDFQVLVDVVAVRTSPTPARRRTLGNIKAQYR